MDVDVRKIVIAGIIWLAVMLMVRAAFDMGRMSATNDIHQIALRMMAYRMRRENAARDD